MVLLAAGVYWGVPREAEVQPPLLPEPAVLPAPKETLAVLHFENLSADPELEWLRTGLTDMLVTDLSQAPGLDVVSPGRLHQLLKELDQLGEARLDQQQVAQLAERAGVAKVVVGSYFSDQGTLQISLRMQDAMSGQILASQRTAQAAGASLFSLIDDLSSELRSQFEVVQAGVEMPDRQLEEVTTASVEAYRYYVEGRNLHYEVKLAEAVPYYEKALELDPEFAMAMVSLGAAHEGLGHAEESRRYKLAAFERSERLPEQERLFIEGEVYRQTWQTYYRAIQSYRDLLQLNPDHPSARYHLATTYGFVERYQEALEQFYETQRRGTHFPGIENGLARMHAALGNFDQGLEEINSLLERDPASWSAYMSLAWHLTDWGRVDEAFTALGEVEKRLPVGIPYLEWCRWRAAVLAEDWDLAEETGAKLARGSDPYQKFLGSRALALTRLYQGRSRAALELLEDAALAYPQPGGFTAVARARAADVLLLLGRPEDALEQAQKAQNEAPGEWPQLQGLVLSALGEAQLGRHAAARERLAELERLYGPDPGLVEARQRRALLGALALESGDPAGALSELGRAATLLSPRGILFHWHKLPGHVPIWYLLAQAEEAAGNDDAAAEWYGRIIESTSERIDFPIRYVRSLYSRAAILERDGQVEAARELYRRYLGYWGEGELDRTNVERAKRQLPS